MSPSTLTQLRGELHRWFEREARELPWRTTRTPYSVWVSEIMLQQTRVDTVIPYFESFMRRFPDPVSLASADPEEVRALWSGLGYYRRAQLMLRAARIIAEEHGGDLPASREALRALPGFGPYTVGAVASMAFDLREPCVDGNIERVLSRLHLIRSPRGEGRRALGEAAQAWVDGPHPGKTNEALMELGATVCGRKPRCLVCPLRAGCRARAAGVEAEIPPPRTRKPPRTVQVEAQLYREADRVLLVKQPPEGLFPELWSLPLREGFSGSPPIASIEHRLTHRLLQVRIVAGQAPAPDDARWVELSALSEWALPSLVPKMLKAALTDDLPALARSGACARRSSRRA